jgi:DNA topoisomerase VI subunit B
MISVSTEDNGRGIVPKSLDLVFDLFAQEKDADAPTEEGGLGIGLTLARSLVELHGGRIEVLSPSPGRGTKFTVWLPAYKENPKLASPEARPLRPTPDGVLAPQSAGGDHGTNIAGAIVYVVGGTDVRHEHRKQRGRHTLDG